jgi:heat-inducible transcriptional repressor
VARSAACGDADTVELTDRQQVVLKAVTRAYVGDAAPIGSRTLAQLLPVNLSSASVRNTLAELTQLGLVEKPHRSAGSVPTEQGLRQYVDHLLEPGDLGSYERRSIASRFDDAAYEDLVSVASRLLSECTRQLGFIVAPRLDRVVLRHVSLVRLSTERVLVVLVSQEGAAHRRVIEDELGSDQPELDRIASMLNDRISGHTLPEVRARLAREARALRHQADRLLTRALELGRRALVEGDDELDLVIGTRLALLDQPEFHDPQRVRELFVALETKERLLEVLDRMLEENGVSVVIGEEVDDPSLRRFALVAARYGDASSPLGALGVIGPSRMDYGRVIPLVDYLSRVITEKLGS